MFSIHNLLEYMTGIFNILTADDIIREFGIIEILISMGMDGKTCGFISICPTQDEMQVCKRVVVSHYIYWDTSAVHFNVSLEEKDNRYELYAESPFPKFFNSTCEIDLEYQ